MEIAAGFDEHGVAGGRPVIVAQLEAAVSFAGDGLLLAAGDVEQPQRLAVAVVPEVGEGPAVRRPGEVAGHQTCEVVAEDDIEGQAVIVGERYSGDEEGGEREKSGKAQESHGLSPVDSSRVALATSSARSKVSLTLASSIILHSGQPVTSTSAPESAISRLRS